MDLARETRQAQKQADEGLQNLSGKISNMEEALKDREQAVLFGSRCLSCNRAYDDTVKTPGTVNLPAEQRKAQIFAEIQRALHNPRTDPKESIKLLAVKVGRPCASTKPSREGPFASRDSSSLAYGIEDVQLLPLRAHSSLSKSRASPRASPRPTTQSMSRGEERSLWSHGRGPSAEHRFKVYEDIKSAVS
ncbi:unnamed protein product [Effrenium voratum]|uniref:Uncharacterized protein n=1 Tax=Effrenium voratum TaxID=2562239 RepID=A0AA36HRW1_9DINO|nr:unnamed protein product [Effrenium voratum]CAJ1373911.1 unnamed protein product [Effrenium voratum]